jgi:hypothetical protein
MPKQIKTSIQAKGLQIAVYSTANQADYISLTDIARYKSDAPDDVVKNWLRNRETIEFLGLWEQLNNPDFKPVEFDGFRAAAGRNAFVVNAHGVNLLKSLIQCNCKCRIAKQSMLSVC